MILSHKSREYFKFLQAKVSQAMARQGSHTPYFLDDDPVIKNYEIIREVWFDGTSIQHTCQRHNLSRSQYYEKENNFIHYGVLGLFPEIKTLRCSSELERLILMVSDARPSLSQQSILRVAEAVPLTAMEADIDSISDILASYGRSPSDQPADRHFWDRIQRTLNQLYRLKEYTRAYRHKSERKKNFFQDEDSCQKRLELLREFFFNPSLGIKEVCMQYGIAITSFYRLVNDYRLFGPWAIISAYLPGKEAMSSETELNILLKKLRYPYWSAHQMVKVLKLRCSRYAVNRVFVRWGLTDKNRPSVALDQYSPSERGNVIRN
jgi:hypothetical protein